MNKIKLTTLLLAHLFLVAACNQSNDSTHAQQMKSMQQVQPGAFQGKVTQTMDSGGYTYVAISHNGEEVWAATNTMKVAVGDSVSFSTEQPMHNFTSKTLNRTFSTVYFVSAIHLLNGSQSEVAQTTPANPKEISSKQEAESTPVAVTKAENGYSIQEIYSKKQTLKGKQVTVRGEVVKYTANILGKNWIHIKDGTGDTETNDLTITSKEITKVGDVILVSGLLNLDKDFGAGYKYTAIVEDAELTVE